MSDEAKGAALWGLRMVLLWLGGWLASRGVGDSDLWGGLFSRIGLQAQAYALQAQAQATGIATTLVCRADDSRQHEMQFPATAARRQLQQTSAHHRV